MKKALSIIAVAAMLLSMFAFGISAKTVDSEVEANWNTMAIKFAARTKNPITVKDENGNTVLKTEGYVFNKNSDNGIETGIPAYADFPGANGAAIITSKYQTPLDNLELDISLTDFDFTNDTHYISNNIGILWTEDPIDSLDNLATLDDVRLYGINHLIPNKSSEISYKFGVPAAKADASEVTGKALSINICNSYNTYNKGTKVATTLTIVYYDGHFINQNDGYYGYRWVFTVNDRSNPEGQTPNVVGNFENIDLTNGLKVKIKSNAELGYIVEINGTEYYKGSDITSFPSASLDGYSHPVFTNEDIENNSSDYLTSMSNAKKDIDLSGLTACGNGYLTVAVTGKDDSKSESDADNITVNTINGIPAASWKGESACNHPEMAWKVIKEATCGDSGVEAYACTECDFYTESNVIPATNQHTYPDNWTVTKTANCTEEGLQTKACTVCGNTIGESIAIDPDVHNKETIVTKSPTCTEEGLSETECSLCKIKFDDEAKVLNKADHTPGDWVITVEPTYAANGEKKTYCTVCNAELETEYIAKLEFDDVSEKDWYYNAVSYCVGKGYVVGIGNNKFNPSGTLTREQFVVILARVANADLTQYTKTDFTDVDASSWYGPSVIWANEMGYAKGVGNGKFGVGKNIDRESLATLFFRYAEKNNIDTTLKADVSTYIDAAQVSDWARESVEWAVQVKIINSTSTTQKILSPKKTLTRAQFAHIFMNYENNI